MTRRLLVPAIIGTVALGAGLRIWGMGWGLPTAQHYFSYHPDETIVLLSAMQVNFFDGQLDPGFYNYGSLYIYMVSIAVLLASCWGLVDIVAAGSFSAIGEFAKLYMAGRVVALLLGIATVYLVYVLGKRAYGRGIGLLAALFMAIMPLHVMHSKFLAVDVPATFFAAAALVFALRITDGHRVRDYLLAGLFAGLAAGTKYNAGLVVLSPMVAHFASDKAQPIRRVLSAKLAAVVPMAAVGFLIGTPGAVLNFDAFSKDFVYEVAHTSTGHGLVFAGTACGYIHHLTNSLWPGMGLPLLVLAVAGVVYAVRKHTTADLALLMFVIAYYGLIGAAQVKFARYTMPLLPLLAVLAARFCVEMADRREAGVKLAKSTGYIVIAVFVLFTAYTLTYSLALDRMFAATDTRDRAADWVRHNVPPFAAIGLPTIPWFYTPPLDTYFGLLDPADRFERSQEFMDYILVVSEDTEWDAEFLELQAPEHVILSEFEYYDRLRIGDPAAREYFHVLRRDYRVERRFADEPSLLGGRVPILRKLPHDMSYASPTVLIYSRKGVG